MSVAFSIDMTQDDCQTCLNLGISYNLTRLLVAFRTESTKM